MGRAVVVETLLNGLTDLSGLPLSGGKVYSYDAGTLIARSLYTSLDKTGVAANPVILDTRGRAQVYADGLYKFIVKDSTDTTLYTWDNLPYFYQDSLVDFGGTSTGAANTYNVTCSSAIYAYVEGQKVHFKTHQANTNTTPTLNVNSLGAVTMKTPSGGALTIGDIQSGCEYAATYTAASGGGFLVFPYTPKPETIVTTEAQLVSAESAASNIVVAAAITLTAHRTFTKPIKILAGCAITTSTFTLTLNGALDLGIYQGFVATGGSVVLGKAIPSARLEWFGATGDGTTDDTAAITSCLNACSTYYTRIIPCQGKTYRLSTVTLPQRANISGDSVQNGGAFFKANSASTMFVLPVGGGENLIHISGIVLNGNSTAASCIDVNGNSYTYIHDCYLSNATIGIDHRDGGYYNRIERNHFYSTDTAIFIDNSSNAMVIANNVFEGTQTYCISTAATNTSDSIEIRENYFATTSTTDDIKLQTTAGFQGKSATIVRNRFDNTPSSSHINLTRYVQAIVDSNSIAGATANLIKIDGTNCDIRNNYLASSTGAAIAVSANASATRIRFQQFGTGGVACASQFSDAGTNTRIERIVLKGVTGSRPTLLACDVGVQYFDTTLAANGMPIWWTGAFWVRHDGVSV